jgi:hypothetical protein
MEGQPNLAREPTPLRNNRSVETNTIGPVLFSVRQLQPSESPVAETRTPRTPVNRGQTRSRSSRHPPSRAGLHRLRRTSPVNGAEQPRRRRGRAGNAPNRRPGWPHGVIQSLLLGSLTGKASGIREGKMAILRIIRLRPGALGAIDTGNGPALLAVRMHSRRTAGTRLSR